MINVILSTRIADFRAATAALPVTAPDDVMNAATTVESRAFDLVRRIPASHREDVAAKLALASELLCKPEYQSWGRRLAEKAVEELHVIEWNEEWGIGNWAEDGAVEPLAMVEAEA